MNNNTQRIEQFKSEVDELKLRGGSGDNERKLLILGTVLVVGGLIAAIYGAVQVGYAFDSPADQRAFMAQGSFIGLALIIAGAALFVRYSLGRYMRYWLIRMTYESRANTDRIVQAIENAGQSEAADISSETNHAEH